MSTRITESDLHSLRSKRSNLDRDCSKDHIQGLKIGNNVWPSIYDRSQNGTQLNQEAKKQKEEKPSLQEIINIISEWWGSVNPNKQSEVPVMTIKRLMVRKKLMPNLDEASKVIIKLVGKVDNLDFQNFYKLFCRGIFRLLI